MKAFRVMPLCCNNWRYLIGVSCCVRMIFSVLLGPRKTLKKNAYEGVSLKHQNSDIRWWLQLFYCFITTIMKWQSKIQYLKKVCCWDKKLHQVSYVVIETNMVFHFVFHSTGRVLRMISDPVMAKVFLKPIHYKNKPFQIYWKFYHQKMKIFR